MVRPLAARFFPDKDGGTVDHQVAFFDGRAEIARHQTAYDVPTTREVRGLDAYACRLED